MQHAVVVDQRAEPKPVRRVHAPRHGEVEALVELVAGVERVGLAFFGVSVVRAELELVLTDAGVQLRVEDRRAAVLLHVGAGVGLLFAGARAGLHAAIHPALQRRDLRVAQHGVGHRRHRRRAVRHALKRHLGDRARGVGGRGLLKVSDREQREGRAEARRLGVAAHARRVDDVLHLAGEGRAGARVGAAAVLDGRVRGVGVLVARVLIARVLVACVLVACVFFGLTCVFLGRLARVRADVGRFGGASGVGVVAACGAEHNAGEGDEERRLVHQEAVWVAR